MPDNVFVYVNKSEADTLAVRFNLIAFTYLFGIQLVSWNLTMNNVIHVERELIASIIRVFDFFLCI